MKSVQNSIASGTDHFFDVRMLWVDNAPQMMGEMAFSAFMWRSLWSLKIVRECRSALRAFLEGVRLEKNGGHHSFALKNQ